MRAFIPAADPEFPVGGVDLRRGRFSVKMYAKTKLGPAGGGGGERAPPMSTWLHVHRDYIHIFANN